VANLTDVLHAIVDLIQENGPGVKADVRRQIDQLGAEALTDIEDDAVKLVTRRMADEFEEAEKQLESPNLSKADRLRED